MSLIKKNITILLIFFILIYIFHKCGKKTSEFTNTIGLKFKKIPADTFLMGETRKFNSKKLGGPEYLENGNYDEQPVHRVEITKPFFISVTEVTVEQFRKFRPSYSGIKEDYPYATGISWFDANDFCEWLSEKEGVNYRLPTESEWEYVCKTGIVDTNQVVFIDSTSRPNKWGIKNMQSGPAEWVYDWYGRYSDHPQSDPVGVESGFAKVVRGGGLDKNTPFYRRATNRAGIAPDFPPVYLQKLRKVLEKVDSSELNQRYEKEHPEGFESRMAYQDFFREELNNHGRHHIGFRIVQAPLPESKPIPRNRPFVQQGVKQSTEKSAHNGPDPDKPYFRKRYLLPTPPENIIKQRENNAVHLNKVLGFDPGILSHHHSPALEVMPNGDLLAIYYTAVSEITPDVAMIASRLRFGSDQWSYPDLLLDFPDVDDHSPLLWRDGETVKFFWGANKLDPGFPFQWISSKDNGATWSRVNFPFFKTPIGGHSAQPINSAFRDSEGTIYIASDGIGPESVLWKSKDNGKTWLDPGGRTGGRHTTFALLNNGNILGMGGKSSNINGYMPKSISRDKGHSWKIKETPFTPLGSNQRPTLIRLKSGRLFFAGDYQRIDGYQPDNIDKKGSYVALSDNEGKTWHVKKLPGTQRHESLCHREEMQANTIGYSVARQAPNGVIHLITSMNEPNLHFAFNEAWILSDSNMVGLPDKKLMNQSYNSIKNVKKYTENYPDGSQKIIYHAGIAPDGKYILDGMEFWYYKNGDKKYEVEYDKGQKINKEIYWRKNSTKKWSRQYKCNNKVVWTTYWENGKKRTRSHWKNMFADGKATMWDKNGNIISEVEFKHGKPLE